ncbi:hypothetical protein ACQ4N7_17675 [Nodosilinea sp. AN01ver1]|uniref:hypothetical protein n=1 Tax=Nodosilinea sp. AN01ver1 TaxID=3423362 RepID=UPI003D3234FC
MKVESALILFLTTFFGLIGALHRQGKKLTKDFSAADLGAIAVTALTQVLKA